MPDAVLRVKVTPKARENKIELLGEELQVRVQAAPVDGKANRELVKLLAKQLHVAPSRVVISSGESGRHKVVRIVELDITEVMRRLGLET
jgi:uncharacterized protein (TIGR00251 family)